MYTVKRSTTVKMGKKQRRIVNIAVYRSRADYLKGLPPIATQHEDTDNHAHTTEQQ